MKSSYVTVACVLGSAGVALGAFGAHALASITTPNRMETWATAVDYHLFHTLAMLALSAMFRGQSSVWLQRALLAFTAGIIVFSGSLYALVISGVGILGAITPIGGVLLLMGWMCAFAASRELAGNE